MSCDWGDCIKCDCEECVKIYEDIGFVKIYEKPVFYISAGYSCQNCDFEYNIERMFDEDKNIVE